MGSVAIPNLLYVRVGALVRTGGVVHATSLEIAQFYYHGTSLARSEAPRISNGAPPHASVCTGSTAACTPVPYDAHLVASRRPFTSRLCGETKNSAGLFALHPPFPIEERLHNWHETCFKGKMANGVRREVTSAHHARHGAPVCHTYGIATDYSFIVCLGTAMHSTAGFNGRQQSRDTISSSTNASEELS